MVYEKRYKCLRCGFRTTRGGLTRHKQAYAKRVILFLQIKSHLRDVGVVRLKDLTLMFKLANMTFHKINTEFNREFFIFKLSAGCSKNSSRRGGLVFGGTALFGGDAGSRRYVVLKDDPRLIDFIVDTIPKPVSEGKVKALTRRLKSIFDKEIAQQITSRVYNYTEAWKRER